MAQAQNVDTYFEPQVLLHKKYILTRNENRQNELMGPKTVQSKPAEVKDDKQAKSE